MLKNQKGTALFVAVMMLVLSTGLGLLALRVSLTELQISSYGKRELAAGYLAESGIEKVLSWISEPEGSPDALFFESLGSRQKAGCTGSRSDPDFQLAPALREDTASGPFSELTEMGKILDLRLYRGNHPRGLCAVEVKADGGKGAVKAIRVELERSPIQPMTAAIQGSGNGAVASPTWAHWGKIRYTGNAHLGNRISKIPAKNSLLPPNAELYTENGLNQDPWLEIQVEKRIESPFVDPGNGSGKGTEEESGRERNQPYTDRPNVYENDPTVTLDAVNLEELKRYAKRYGSYYVVSPTGSLEQNGVDKGTFDQLFYPPASDHRLIWIDLLPGYSNPEPIVLERKRYKGYFYFTGNVKIQGDQTGEKVLAQSPPWPSNTPQRVELNPINLDGFFYTLGELNLQGAFSAYGALFAGQGFTGPGAAELEVWYNDRYHSADYSGLPPVARLKGTWNPLPTAEE